RLRVAADGGGAARRDRDAPRRGGRDRQLLGVGVRRGAVGLRVPQPAPGGHAAPPGLVPAARGAAFGPVVGPRGPDPVGRGGAGAPGAASRAGAVAAGVHVRVVVHRRGGRAGGSSRGTRGGGRLRPRVGRLGSGGALGDGRVRGPAAGRVRGQPRRAAVWRPAAAAVRK